LDSNQQPNG